MNTNEMNVKCSYEEKQNYPNKKKDWRIHWTEIQQQWIKNKLQNDNRHMHTMMQNGPLLTKVLLGSLGISSGCDWTNNQAGKANKWPSKFTAPILPISIG